jgi:3-oxoacyl-[acyl-carrier-protein] synthase-1/3-oxoacyl-[acyl-carrier-protein] synthase II
MQPIAIVAVGAVSPLGVGDAAFAVGAPGEQPVTRVQRDAALVARGQARPLAARAPIEPHADDDRARALLQQASERLLRDLERTLPGWRARRLALCVGTSAGGMPTLERALAARADGVELDPDIARRALYDGPLATLGALFAAPVVQVLAACASSTLAIGLGARWLDAGVADLVVAGGYDALSDFVSAGFEALGATTGSELLPFRLRRDGMALGEGAALVALVRANEAPRAFGYVLGFSTTNDARHVTAPDPEGRGLANAASAALADGGALPSHVDLLSAHATATRHNDSAEARAIRRALGAERSDVVVHPFKAVTGHCLGASGALETLAALDAMRTGVLPGALGDGPLEADFSCRLLPRNQSAPTRCCLKLSAGFGGANAALVLAPSPGEHAAPSRARRAVRVISSGELVTEPSLDSLGRFRAVDEARLARLSEGGALAVSALASALAKGDGLASLPRDRVGVVVAATAACLEENEKFDRVRRERGARGVEPKRFSRTSPNVPAGECAIACGFSGPAFAVGGGPSAALEALLVGSDLVAFGDVDYAVVIASDEVGDVVGDLFARALLPVPRHGALAVVLGAAPDAAPALERDALADILARGALAESGVGLLTMALSRATRTPTPG